MIVSWLLHELHLLFTAMANAMPSWTYTIQPGSWITAFMQFLWAYDQGFIPLHDALIPVLKLHMLLYTSAIVIRLYLAIMNFVRGSGAGSGL